MIVQSNTKSINTTRNRESHGGVLQPEDESHGCYQTIATAQGAGQQLQQNASMLL